MIIKENIKIKLTTPLKVFNIMKNILANEDVIDKDKEHFWVIGVDTGLKVKYIDLVSLGSLDTSIVHPREVFRLAVMKAVSSVILVHNHPSGNVEPSEEDIELTKRLKKSGEILGINVIDHVIISTGTYFSFSETGLLNQN